MSLSLFGTVSDNTVALDRKTATPLIINGDMAIAQRGTSATALGNGDTGYHTVDRFQFREDGSPTYEFTMSQSTDTPTGQGFSKSLKLDCTTADTSLASADALSIRHTIEAQNLQLLDYGISSAKTLTLTYWVKTNKTGTYTLWVYSEDGSRNISKTYTVSSANTWEKKVINIDADTGGTINNDNGIGLILGWYLGAGTDFTSGTLNTSWNSLVTANRVSSSNVNLSDSTDNEWYITGVQLEVGTFDANSIADFQFEDVGTSLARCQRYFQKSFPQGTTPQNYSSYVAGQSDNSIGATMSSTEFKTVITLKCEMRSAPTITYYRAQNTPEDGEWTFFDGGDKLNPSSMASNSQTHRFTAVLTYSSGLTAGNSGLCQGNYKADAEL